MNWGAIEPEPGQFDAEYLASARDLIAACGAVGVYSKEIGQDGAPLWAIVPPPAELLGGPLEDLEVRRLSVQVINVEVTVEASDATRTEVGGGRTTRRSPMRPAARAWTQIPGSGPAGWPNGRCRPPP